MLINKISIFYQKNKIKQYGEVENDENDKDKDDDDENENDGNKDDKDV